MGYFVAPGGTDHGIFNAKDFGAAGDGTTDDTRAAATTITTAIAAGGTAYFPPGNYSITAPPVPVTAWGPVSIRGAGWATTFTMSGPWSAGGALFGLGDVTHIPTGVFFEDFRIDGQCSIKGNVTAGGINLRNVTHCRVRRVYFLNCSYQTCQVAGGTDVTIRDCFFSGGGNGTQGATTDHISINTAVAPLSDVVVAGNISFAVPDVFCEVDGATNVTISANTVETSIANTTGIDIAGGARITVTGNTINLTAAGTGILVTPYLGGMTGTTNASDIAVTGNTITSTAASGTNYGINVATGGATGGGMTNARVSVTGNTVRGALSSGITIQNNPSPNTITGVTIAGNLCDSCGIGIDTFTLAGTTTTNILIADNTVTASTAASFGGISVRGAQAPTGFVIRGNSSIGGAAYGIFINTAFTGITAVDNYLAGNTTAATNLTTAQKQTQTWANNGPQDPDGTFILGGPVRVSAAATLYSGVGAPSVAGSIAGDLYLRTDTPGTSLQRLYMATAANTWAGIV